MSSSRWMPTCRIRPRRFRNLLAAADAGHDYVGTIRKGRQDHWARTFLSRRINALRDRMTPIRITDQGCMLRAYSRPVIDAVNASEEVNTFIPALAYLYARQSGGNRGARMRRAMPESPSTPSTS